MKLEELNRPILYLDRKYLVIKFDKSNYAILSRLKLKKLNRVAKAILGYYGSLNQALGELVRLRSEDILLYKIKTKGTFRNLQEFINEYIKTTITITKATIGSEEAEAEIYADSIIEM